MIFLVDDQINRDPISNEMVKMRQQLEYLQAELCARGGGVSFDEIQVSASFPFHFQFQNFLIILRQVQYIRP